MNPILKIGNKIEQVKSYLQWARSLNHQSHSQRQFFSLDQIQNFFSGGGTITDKGAIQNGYAKNSSWYSISTKVARGVSALPFKLYKDSGSEKVEITQGDLYDLIFTPNAEQSLRELFEEQTIYLANNGEAYFYLDNGGSLGRPAKRIIALPAELMTPIKGKSILDEVTGYKMKENGKTTIFLPEEILHIVYTNPTLSGKQKRNGLSPLVPGANKLEASNQNAQGQSSYFKNRGVSNIISADGGASGISLTPQDEDSLKAATMDKYGGAQQVNGIVTVPSPVRVHQLGSSSSDMEMLGHDKQYLRDLCNLVFMPSELLNDPDNKTHANRREAVKTAYNDVFIPNAELILLGYSRTILKWYSDAHSTKYCLEIDYESIDALKPDPMALRELLIKEVDAGIKTPNEARIAQNTEAHEDEDMDKPRIRNNYTVLGNESKAKES